MFWGTVTVLMIATAASTYLAWDVIAPSGSTAHHQVSTRIAMRLIDVFVVGWTLWVGAAIGSFLNVVAYRLPLGRSLNGRSHCPTCDHQLSWNENTPVLGWIFLGGRCRHCDQPISPRYPLVEWMVGLTLGGIALVRVYNISLPHDPVSGFRGRFDGPLLGDIQTWITLLVHVTAISVLWAMALIRYDGGRFPVKMVWAIVGLVAAMVAMPWLNIESWKQVADLPAANWQGGPEQTPSRLDALVACIAAIVTATLIGRSLARGLNPSADLKLDPLGKGTRRMVDLIAMLSVVALIFGWQSTIALVVVASWLAWSMGWFRGFPDDPLSRLGVALVLVSASHMMVWHWLHGQTYWPSDTSEPVVILGWATAALCVPIWLRCKPEFVAGGFVAGGFVAEGFVTGGATPRFGSASTGDRPDVDRPDGDATIQNNQDAHQDADEDDDDDDDV